MTISCPHIVGNIHKASNCFAMYVSIKKAECNCSCKYGNFVEFVMCLFDCATREAVRDIRRKKKYKKKRSELFQMYFLNDILDFGF